ncbi:MAG: methyltransferase [Bacteroidales bacterium]
MQTTDQLKSFFTEHWKYMAVSTACKLNFFDQLLNEGKTSEELSNELDLNKKETLQLLNALVSFGFLKKERNIFSLTNISLHLTENHPQSFKYACLNWSAEHLNAWQHLYHSIQTGESSFEKLYGSSYFDFLNAHPDKLINYHRAMNEYAREDYASLPHIIDWSQYNTLIDVGGGFGSAIQAIKQCYPNLACSLFDLELVINNSGVKDVETIGGNFFENIPGTYDAMILSRVLHDWEDDKTIAILSNCYNALSENGTLFVIENCSTNLDDSLALLSLNMLAMCKSYERSENEYINLCNKTGFSFHSKKQLNSLQTILIFRK